MREVVGLFSAILSRVGEAITLRNAEAEAAPQLDPQLTKLCRAVQGRLALARALAASGDAGPAAALYRDAAQVGLCAREAAGLGPPLAPEGSPAQAALGLTELPHGYAFDELDPSEASRRLDVVDRGIVELLRGVPARSVAQVRRARWLRWVGLGSVALVGCAGAVVWWTAPVNVALGKPVTAESLWSATVTPAALVNGSYENPWGAATAATRDPWFEIDLGHDYRLRRVVVVNRNDDHAAASGGVAIEVSRDGSSFEQVARDEETRLAGRKWKLELDGVEARYVRVRRVKGRGGFALREIEVYAK